MAPRIMLHARIVGLVDGVAIAPHSNSAILNDLDAYGDSCQSAVARRVTAQT